MKKSSVPLLALLFVVLVVASCSVENNIDTDTESIWVINKMELKENLNINQYYQSLQANWATPRNEGLKDGLLMSYDIIPVPKEKGWEFLLVTQYSDEEQLNDFKDNFSVINDKVNPEGIVFVDGLGPRDFALQTESKVLTNIELKQMLASINTGA